MSKIITFALSALFVATHTAGQPVPGSYKVFPISVPGFPIGAVSSTVIGVLNDTVQDPSLFNFTVTESPLGGFTLSLPMGNAVVSSDEVGLGPVFTASFWNIATVSGDVYAIETIDGSLGWTLLHDVPPGTPVSLTTPDSSSPDEFFQFEPL